MHIAAAVIVTTCVLLLLTHNKMDAPDSTTVKIALDDPLDRTLTTKNIVLSLTDILHWFQLGKFLEIEGKQLKRIEQAKLTLKDRITEMVGQWLRSDPLATWRKLVDALKEMGEHQVASKIVNDYPELKRRHEEEERDKAEKLKDLLRRLDELELQQLLEDTEWARTNQEWKSKLENVQRCQFEGDSITVVQEWYKMLDGQKVSIKTRKQKWKETAQELETLQNWFLQAEKELSTRLEALLQLGEEHTGLQEFKSSLQKCRRTTQCCQDRLNSYEYLKSEKLLSDPLGLDDPFDRTLTTKHVISSLRDIWEWFPLGLSLGFRYAELKRIEQDKQTTEDCIREMVGQWLRDPLATWRNLMNALIDVKECLVALEIVINYPEMKRKHEKEEQEKLKKFNDLQRRLEELEKERQEDDAEWERISQEWRIKLETVRQDHAEFQHNKECERERLRREFVSKKYKERAKLFANSRVEREDLQHMGERIDALVEWDKIVRDRKKKIKLWQQKWKESAEELGTLCKSFKQDEEELKIRHKALSQLGEKHSKLLLYIGAGYRRFEELKKSMKECTEIVTHCQDKLQSYQKYLKSDAVKKSECRRQLESTKGEIENLKHGYERCVRKVQNFQKELTNQKKSLLQLFVREAGSFGLSYTGAVIGSETGVVTGLETGALLGSLFGPAGTAVGATIGGIAGWVGGAVGGAVIGTAAGEAIFKPELETCEKELKASIETVEKGKRILEKMRDEDD